MGFHKSLSLSLASFPPWNTNEEESVRSDGLNLAEGAAKVAAEAVSTVEKLSGCELEPFIPNNYTAQLDWHKGPRAALSRLFPRYGRYCGPNYSSGREDGSLTWDQAPVDHLDYCCYRHDMAYDSHDQAVLLQADIKLLKCMNNRPRKEDGKKVELVYPWGDVYEAACKQGLQHFLIPYRTALVRLREKKQREEERQRRARQRVEDERRKPSLEA